MGKRGKSYGDWEIVLEIMSRSCHTHKALNALRAPQLLYCRILRNKIGTLHHLGTQSHYEVKHPSNSLYNTLYPAAAAAYTAAAAAYQITPQIQHPQAPQNPPGASKLPSTPSPPVSNPCRAPWPVTDLLNMRHMQDQNNYNYYMYLQSCGQSNLAQHPHTLSSPLGNTFAGPIPNTLPTTALPNTSFPNSLSMVGVPTPGLTPQAATL